MAEVRSVIVTDTWQTLEVPRSYPGNRRAVRGLRRKMYDSQLTWGDARRVSMTLTSGAVGRQRSVPNLQLAGIATVVPFSRRLSGVQVLFALAANCGRLFSKGLCPLGT